MTATAPARSLCLLYAAACSAVLSIGTSCAAPCLKPEKFPVDLQALWTQEWKPDLAAHRKRGAFRVVNLSAAAQLALDGTYVGRAPANDAAKRTFSLVLSADGSAVWNTFYLGKAHSSLTGHWRQTGPELVLSFDPLGSGAPPRPITFLYHHHELQPIHWDQSEWGGAGPPVLHRTRDRSGAVNS